MIKQVLYRLGHAQSRSNHSDCSFSLVFGRSLIILLFYLFGITTILKAQEPVTIYRYATPGTQLGRILEPGNFIFVRSIGKLYELTGLNPIGKAETPQSIVASGKFKDYTPGSSHKTYTAYINQSGFDPVVLTLLENTIGDIVFSWDNSHNVLNAELTGAFITGKTVAYAIDQNEGFKVAGLVDYAPDRITWELSNYSGSITNLLIEIRVYP